jgi:hypothetical protein
MASFLEWNGDGTHIEWNGDDFGTLLGWIAKEHLILAGKF